jgi:hypothetical protein
MVMETVVVVKVAVTHEEHLRRLRVIETFYFYRLGRKSGN